jgi:hypothetical protein
LRASGQLVLAGRRPAGFFLAFHFALLDNQLLIPEQLWGRSAEIGEVRIASVDAACATGTLLVRPGAIGTGGDVMGTTVAG